MITITGYRSASIWFTSKKRLSFEFAAPKARPARVYPESTGRLLNQCAKLMCDERRSGRDLQKYHQWMIDCENWRQKWAMHIEREMRRKERERKAVTRSQGHRRD